MYNPSMTSWNCGKKEIDHPFCQNSWWKGGNFSWLATAKIKDHKQFIHKSREGCQLCEKFFSSMKFNLKWFKLLKASIALIYLYDFFSLWMVHIYIKYVYQIVNIALGLLYYENTCSIFIPSILCCCNNSWMGPHQGHVWTLLKTHLT